MTEGAEGPLHPGVAAGAGVLLVLAAFPASVVALAVASADPNPESLSAGVLVLAAVWAWLALRAPGAGPIAPPRRELAAGLASLAAVVAVAWLWPVDELSMFSKARPDLLLLPAFAAAVALVAGGRDCLKRTRGPVLLLFMAWPPLAAALAAGLDPSMLALAEGGGAALARAAGVAVTRGGGSEHILVATGRAGSHAMVVGTACSGVSGILAVAVAAAPVVSLAGGSPCRKALWAGSGCAVVALLTPVRVAFLAYIAAHQGAAGAFKAFHVLGGTAFFVLVWAAMLGLARAFGLTRPPLAEVSGARTLPSGHAGRTVLAGVVALSLAAGAGNARMHVWSRLPRPPEPEGPAIAGKPEFRLPKVDGFKRWHFRSLPWVRSMYGPESRMERHVYSPGEGPYFWVDVLLGQDFARLEKHTVVGCYRWHSYRIERAEALAFADALPARRFVHRDSDGRRWASMTWIECLRGGDDPWWQRTSVQRRVGKAETGLAALEAVTDFAPKLRAVGDHPPADGERSEGRPRVRPSPRGARARP